MIRTSLPGIRVPVILFATQPEERKWSGSLSKPSGDAVILAAPFRACQLRGPPEAGRLGRR